MPTLYVREVPEQLYKQVREIASAQGRSLSAFVVTVLEQAVEDESVRAARGESLARIRRRRRKLSSATPDSESLLRKIREEHG